MRLSYRRTMGSLMAVLSTVGTTTLLGAVPAIAQAVTAEEPTAQAVSAQEATPDVSSEADLRAQEIPGSVPTQPIREEGSLSGENRAINDLTNAQYILGPGDQLEISVFGYEEYAGTYDVLSDGTISLPVLGPMRAANRTLASFDADLTQALNRLLVEPDVTVQLASRRAITVTVAGAVQRPGPIEMEQATRSGTSATLGMPTISTALSQAGGVTRKADIRQVVLTRRLPDGELSSTRLNLWDAIWVEGSLAEGGTSGGTERLILRDGDTIVVPELAEGNQLDQRLVARSTLAPETVRVRVVGEVTSPGEVQVPPDSTLSSAVAIAGGPTGDAALHRVELIRLNEQGTIESREIDLQNLIDEVQIQQGDVVIVPERNASTVLGWAQRILNPFGAVLNIINRF